MHIGILDHFPEGVLVVDAADIIRWATQATVELTGWPIEELQGMSLDQLISREELTGIARARGIGGPQSLQRFHCFLRTKSGERREVSVSMGYAQESGAETKILLVRDIQRQRARECQLLAQLEDKHQLEAFGRVASLVVHDLRNLNNALSMTLRNFRDHVENPAFRREAIEAVEDVAGKIRHLIEKLSHPPARRALHLEVTTVGALVRAALDRLAKAGRKAQVEATDLGGFDPSLPCEVDVNEMEQVLVNLLLNAYEAAEPEGRVTITSYAQANRGQVCLVIQDPGPGISRRLESSLFRPFRSTKPRGMGLGLYHAKLAVEAHGGRIEIANRDDGPGTRVTLTLPGKKGGAQIFPMASSRKVAHVSTEGTAY